MVLFVLSGTTSMADVDGGDIATSAPTETAPIETTPAMIVVPQPETTQAPSASTATPQSATPSSTASTSAAATSRAPQSTAPAAVAPTSAGTSSDSPRAQQFQTAPLAVAQSYATGPHLRWTAQTGQTQLVGGASFDLEFQDCWIACIGDWYGWKAVETVQDCVASDAAQCTERDKNPNAGEFTVDGVESGRKYRIRQTSDTFWHNGGWYSRSSNALTSSSSWSNQVATFSNQIQVAVSTINATVNVNVADTRTSLGNTGFTANHSSGARFGIFPTSASSVPISTCQVPAGSTQCRTTVSVPSGTSVWVGPIASAPGSPAARALADPITTLTTGTSGGFTTRAYRYQTAALNNGVTVTVPSNTVTNNSWDASSGRMVNRLQNPELALSCSAGIKVALVMDLSGSIATSRAQDTLRDAALGLVSSLEGTGSSMALFSFGDTSARPGTKNLPAPLPVDDTAHRATLISQIHNYRTYTVTDQGTNWDAGLLAASVQAKDYDVVLVLTDGNPTFSNTGKRNDPADGSGSLTAFRELERSVLSANAIKAKGARVMAVGIGNDLSRQNLAAISGPRGYEPGLSLNDVDYTTAGWEQLGSLLEQFARGLSCKADVVVEKRTGDTVATATPTGGWTFAHQGTNASDGIPRTEQTTSSAATHLGTTSWTLSFSDPGEKKSVTLTQLSTDASWHLAALECTVNGKPVQVDLAKSATITGVGVGDIVKCVYTSVKTSSVQVDKQWVINGTSHVHGQQPNGYQATLTLTGPATAGASAQEWGKARTGYRAGDKVVITETTELPASLRGCVLDSSLIRPAGSTGPGADVADGHTVTLAAGVNAWTITNTVSCTTLTLTKELQHSFGGTSVITDWVLTSTRGGATTIHPSGEALGVEPGEHVIAEQLRSGSENLADGYEFTHVSCVADGRTLLDGAPSTVGLKLTVPAGTDTVCVLTNADKPGSVQWAKVDEMQRPLAGSAWELRGPDGDVVEVTEATGDGAGTSAGPGQFLVRNLAWGRYTLTESKAPSGYRLAEGSVEFTIGPDADGLNVAFDEPFVNQPYPAVVLPLTGGTARDLYTTAGTALMGAALLVGLAVRRRTHSPTS